VKEFAMPNDRLDLRSDHPPMCPSWGMPGFDNQEAVLADGALWLTGGVALLAWTALALLLTA
jgi:hypothetical protein